MADKINIHDPRRLMRQQPYSAVREMYWLSGDDLIPEFGESVHSPEYIARNEAHKRDAKR